MLSRLFGNLNQKVIPMNNSRPQNLSAALIALEKIKERTGKNIQTVEDTFKQFKKNEDKYFSKITEIDTKKILNWKFHDRPSNELGDIKELAKEFKIIGQQQPCIVRPIKDKNEYYEIIAGERRWLAAREANIKLKVIILDLNDNEAAIIQIAENKNRKDLSDYAKGISYAQLINNSIITQKDLKDKLNISSQKISKLLSYTKIPKEVLSSIDNLSKVSATTAEKIKQLCNKGEDYINAVKKLSSEIRTGKLGHIRLEQKVNILLNNDNSLLEKKQFYNTNKKILFSIYTKNNNTYIEFSHYLQKLYFNQNEYFMEQLNLLAKNIDKLQSNKIPPEG